MRWWCSATGSAWSWAWRPYVGAWVLVAFAAGFMWRGGSFRRDVAWTRRVAAALGLVLFAASIDWPLAALGAGYLATAQALRQVLVVIIAAPLLLAGAPPAFGDWIAASSRRRAVLRVVSHPGLALLLAVSVLVGVNLPPVADATLTSQFGSFAIDAAWIVSGIIMWLPVQVPPTTGAPLAPRLRGPVAVVYLIVASIGPLPVAFFMTWSDFPIYEVYELAPRVVSGLGPKEDQELAAAVLQVLGGTMIWVQIAVRFAAMAGMKRDSGFRGRQVTSGGVS
ncbi:MAG TPA: cytochrome c oxidase assembly protein [Microthrixaceae bacterium]|nr:cytochrome c oxidase assembly protein [Microthrixaceae bacterium]